MTKPTLTAAAVETALAAALGPITGFTPITEGQESQAFRFQDRGRECVVRVNNRAAGFHKDQWAATRIDPSVPVPEVVHIGQIDDDHHFCVSERHTGTIVQDSDTETLHSLRDPVATTLERIAATDVSDIDGYGDFDPLAGKAKFGGWPEYVRHSTRHDWGEYTTAIDADDAARLSRWLVDRSAGLPDVHQLVHGDFGGDNVLVEPGRITAVLDWEAAVIGDPLFDVARMRFWAPFMPCMRVLADHCLARPHDPQRLRCYLVATGLDATAYFAAAGQVDIAAAMLARTSREVD